MSDARFRLLLIAGIAVAAVLIVVAAQMADTDPESDTVDAAPTKIEHVIPVGGSSVLRQSEIGIDLAAGYDADLTIAGIPIPRSQLRLVPEQNQVFFTPGEGKAIEELDAGETCVVATIWKSSEGRGTNDTPARWCFTVT
jgi:hypothetical protein